MLNCIAVSWVQSRWTGLVRLVRVTVGFGWIGLDCFGWGSLKLSKFVHLNFF